MNRKRRNDRKSILFIREQDPNTVYQERRYADQPRQMPLKDWVKRLARAHRHSTDAVLQMFEARFGRPESTFHPFPVISKIFRIGRFDFWRTAYRKTGRGRLLD